MNLPADLYPVTLQNDQIRLEKISEGDFERLYAVAADPLIWEQHPNKDRYKREAFQAFFDGAVQSGSAYLIFETTSGTLIGSSRYYDYKLEISTIAIGFTFLARDYWGGDTNRALKTLMLDHAFLYVDAVLFHIGLDNIRSQKATMKLGAKPVGEVSIGSPERRLTHLELRIDKADWVR